MTATYTADSRATPVGSKVAPTLGYFMAYIALGMASAVLGPTLPRLAEQTGAGLSQISYLFSARLLGDLLGAFVIARLYDHVRGHPLMGAMLLGMAVLMALIPLTPLLAALLVIVLLLGMAAGTVDVGCSTLLVWVHRPNVGPLMNGLHFFFGVGAFLAPAIVARLLLSGPGVSLPYWVMAAIMVPIGLFLLRVASPARPDLAGQGAAHRAKALLIFMMAGMFFLYGGAEVSYGGWVYTYTLRMGLYGEASAALLTAVFWAALTAGRLLSIPLAARVAPRWILLGDLLGGVVSLLVILLLPAQPAALWVGTVGLGLSLASIFPTLLSFAERRMTISGTVTGYLFVGCGLGGMSLPLVIGRLFEPVGPQSAMLAILIDLLVAVLVLGLLLVYTRRTAPGEGREAVTR